MMVGTIADSVPARVKGSAGTFANYPVHLSTDFQGLRYVYVIREKPTHEVRALKTRLDPMNKLHLSALHPLRLLMVGLQVWVLSPIALFRVATPYPPIPSCCCSCP